MRSPNQVLLLQLIRYRRWFTRLALLSLVMVPLASTQTLAQEKIPVDVHLRLREAKISVGQPVVVILELKAPMKTSLDLGANRIGNLIFTISDAVGMNKEVSLRTPGFSS